MRTDERRLLTDAELERLSGMIWLSSTPLKMQEAVPAAMLELMALRAAARAVIRWHTDELTVAGGMLWTGPVPAIEALSRLVPDE